MNKNTKYNFNKEIQDKLKSFKTYLKKRGYGENTVRQKTNYTGYFLNWLVRENLPIEETRYNDLLNFIDYCRLEEKSVRHINRILESIRSFYEYRQKKQTGLVNPATNLILKGTRQKVPSGIIDFTELEKIYNKYKTESLRGKRNKVILSLLIYQGITTGELHNLKPEHLKLKEGKIYIPGNRKRNSRNLELKSFQILELYEYLNEIRPEILNEINNLKTTLQPGRKPDKIYQEKIKDRLFTSMNGSENIKPSLFFLFEAVRKINPDIRNVKQIRASVIIYWLKTYNLRQVQYMAGHKYVSSTERYKLNNLDSLQDKLEKFHPLN